MRAILSLLLNAVLSASEAASPSGVLVRKRLPNFIDLEAPVGQVWVGCTHDGPEKSSNSLMVFYALDGDTAYEFHYRRVFDVRSCLESEGEYRRMMKGAKTVRLVGIHPIEELGPQPSVHDRVPKRFDAVKKSVFHVFIRMQAGDRCKAYFENHCDLPGNYWGGVFPEGAPKPEPGPWSGRQRKAKD